MSDRDDILSKLPASEPCEWVRPAIEQAPGSEVDLWNLFETRFNELGGELCTLERLCNLKGAIWIDEGARTIAQPYCSTEPVHSIWDAEIGVSIGDVAVAESGSVIVSAGIGKARLGSLAPPLSILLVPQQALVATLEEAFDLLSDRTSVVITGPSRTADIEGELVHGVHGPGTLWVIPFPSQQC